jgi:hypothetical protein
MVRKKNIVVTVFLLVIGIGFLTATTVKVINTLMFIARAKTADGVVIVTKHAKRHPRIEYTNAAGEKRWFLANEWITGFRFVSYKMGQHVRVLYDPADPAAFSVDDFASLYTVSIAGGIAGIVFVVLGLYALRGKVTFKTKAMVTAGIYYFFGIGFLIITFEGIGPTREFIAKTQITEGVVIELPHGGSHPKVAFTNASGEKDWIPANGMISGYKVGDRVRVLYYPGNPENPYIHNFHDLFYRTGPDIDDFGALYACSLFCGIFGICGIIVGTMALFGMAEYESD